MKQLILAALILTSIAGCYRDGRRGYYRRGYYVQPRPVYVQPRPVYRAPPPAIYVGPRY